MACQLGQQLQGQGQGQGASPSPGQEQSPRLSIQVKEELLGIPTLQQVVLFIAQGKEAPTGRRRLASSPHSNQQQQQEQRRLKAVQAATLSWGELVDAEQGVVYAAYGRPLSFSLSPCLDSSVSSASSNGAGGEAKCGVRAQDAQGKDLSNLVFSVGMATALDLAGQTGQSGLGRDGEGAAGATLLQLLCGVDMADRGSCLPGAYNIRWVMVSLIKNAAALALLVSAYPDLRCSACSRIFACIHATSFPDPSVQLFREGRRRAVRECQLAGAGRAAHTCHSLGADTAGL